MKTNVTLDKRITGALVGAAIGAELGFARCMRGDRHAVRKPSDIWKLKPEPLKDWEPWLHRVDFAPTRFLVDLGVEAYVSARGRVDLQYQTARLRCRSADAGMKRKADTIKNYMPMASACRWLTRCLVVRLATLALANGGQDSTDQIVVNAGADQTISLGAPAALKATVTSTAPGPLKMFWSKISGPGTAVFSHESFNASFEDGTIGEWTAPSEYGFVGGNQAGGGYVSKEQAHSGVYSWKAYNDPKLAPPENYSAKLIRWRFDYVGAYFSAWYYWPTDYLVDDGTPRSVNILQFKERTKPFDPTWTVNVKSSKSHIGVDHLNLYDCHGRVAYNVPGGLPVPKGRWFHLVVYQKVGRIDGELAVWLDGIRIFNLKDINTLGSATNNNPPFLAWGVGNYGSAGIDKFMYVDDAAVANAATDPRNTSVRFSAPGQYVLRFTASNGQGTVSDIIQVTVK